MKIGLRDPPYPLRSAALDAAVWCLTEMHLRQHSRDVPTASKVGFLCQREVALEA